MSSTCEPSFIKKPLVLVRPATLFTPTACGNDILNAVIRATLLAALIGCAAYYFMYERMSLIMLLSFVIGVLPSIYKV
jgi:hypothetical protein